MYGKVTCLRERSAIRVYGFGFLLKIRPDRPCVGRHNLQHKALLEYTPGQSLLVVRRKIHAPLVSSTPKPPGHAASMRAHDDPSHAPIDEFVAAARGPCEVCRALPQYINVTHVRASSSSDVHEDVFWSILGYKVWLYDPAAPRSTPSHRRRLTVLLEVDLEVRVLLQLFPPPDDALLECTGNIS